MERNSRILRGQPVTLCLIGLTIITDLILWESPFTSKGEIALGNILLVTFYLGISGTLRLAKFKGPLHLGLTWITVVALFFGWNTIAMFVTTHFIYDGYLRLSPLMVLCPISAFKILRISDESSDNSEDI